MNLGDIAQNQPMQHPNPTFCASVFQTIRTITKLHTRPLFLFSLLVIYPLVYINLFSLCSVSGSTHTTNSPLQNSTMSFLGGAECSTAGNPLSQFTKHVQDDKSLQRDRLVGRGPGGLQEGMRSQVIGGGQDNVSLYTVV